MKVETAKPLSKLERKIRRGTRKNLAQKVAHPSSSNLQPTAETCEFSSVPWDIRLILLLLINIVGNRAYLFH